MLFSHHQKDLFIIAIICIIIGAIFRIAYCIDNPVQPRDAYTYGFIISQWELNGSISEEKVLIPFSLWILKVPHHFFQYDAIKGGVIVNLILGLFIITISINCIKHYLDKSAILFTGLILATHPALVRYSCSCLRENTYLFFSLLGLSSLINYCREPCFVNLIFIGFWGALAFLCRLEGLELLPISLITFFFLLIYKRINFTKAFVHGFLLVVVYTIVVVTICNFLGFKIPSPDQFMTKF